MGKSNSKRLEVVGLDLGDQWTSWCSAGGGEVVGEGRVRTQQEAFSRQFSAEPQHRILLETA